MLMIAIFLFWSSLNFHILLICLSFRILQFIFFFLYYFFFLQLQKAEKVKILELENEFKKVDILESKFSNDNEKTMKELLELKSQQLEILEKQNLFNNQTKVGLNAVDKYLESKFKESQRMMQTSYDEVWILLVIFFYIIFFILIYNVLSDINIVIFVFVLFFSLILPSFLL